MNRIIWNWIDSKHFPRRIRDALFLAAVTLVYALAGYLLWLILGQRLFSDRVDWMLCFIGFPAFFPGFLMGIIYLYKYE